ncbi:MAG: helix-turn-helix domain-containing protein [Verrucomicrobia bacterium]|jgi:excisionase family DNA binding protein|nr:helix-turn-helix domain-containing protein [Verrucomicrobiota bacterium]OQC63775.1 MAG: Helix-turn-helix domain protein [Verrucomicrobia bacterium ADurb.Bin006]MDI9381763.1 helix-turn-helix domain-containing protein [Verrucomicrobiota bacterium]NMD19486.1 helix-turn-helix domain-containing protein [Verrucomicrobiota bacterium]HOA61461.1 helix-turn-helix domain-containing protein [Verrucomicrobiota bacterium]
MNDDIMTLPELAAYLKLAERTVYGYAQRGILPGIKVCSAWRFRRADVQAWLEQQRQLTETSTSKRSRKEGAKP